MPVHTPESGSCRRILPIETLEDPELEEGIHDDGHDCHEYVDRLVLEAQCRQPPFHATSNE